MSMWYRMRMEMWDKVIAKTNEHGYMSGVDRQSERVKATGEIFTPTPLVIEIMKKMLDKDREVFAPGKTVIDPACGDGQFLVPIKWYKVIFHSMSEQDALNDIYGVDIMRDNVDLCKSRLGGGHILMGNTLDPTTRLDEQTDFEYNEMKRLFAEENTLENFFG